MNSAKMEKPKPAEVTAPVAKEPEVTAASSPPRKNLIKISTSSIKFISTTGPALEAASPMLSNQLKMEH